FEIKVKTGSIQFQNSNYYVNSALSVAHSNPTLVLNEWVKVEATFFYAVENTSITHIYISGITANNQYEIRNFKIEKGSTATDWTPAIEDQVSDWSETDINKFSYIKNKPTLVNNYVDVIQTTNGTTAGTVYTFKRVGLSDLNITLTPASASFSGVVTTGAQIFEGDKTFLKSPKVPNATNADEAVNKSQLDSVGNAIPDFTTYFKFVSSLQIGTDLDNLTEM